MLGDQTRYEVGTDEGYELLYRRLTSQPDVVAPPVGERRVLPPRPVVSPVRGAASPGPHWNVPNRNPYFTGREEILEALETRLEAAGEAALTQAITGLGGVGKTQTAIEFAHRHRERYGGGVYWADASSAAEERYLRGGNEIFEALAANASPQSSRPPPKTSSRESDVTRRSPHSSS